MTDTHARTHPRDRIRAAFAEAKLTDAQGRLYASATSTLLVMDR